MPKTGLCVLAFGVSASILAASPAQAQGPHGPGPDFVNRGVTPLRDPAGNVRFNLVVVKVGAGPAQTTIEDPNGNTLATLGAPPARPSYPPLAHISDGKADAASAADVQSLQRQIVTLGNRLNQAIDRINALSR